MVARLVAIKTNTVMVSNLIFYSIVMAFLFLVVGCEEILFNGGVVGILLQGNCRGYAVVR